MCALSTHEPILFPHNNAHFYPVLTAAQQLEFHEAFKKATSRVIYKKDWETSKPRILEKHGWKNVKGEVLISTPRRFGKTFSCAQVHSNHNHHTFWSTVVESRVRSIAIYCACLALTFGIEIVVFRCSLCLLKLPRSFV